MSIYEEIKLELETYKDGMTSVDDSVEKIMSIAFNLEVKALQIREIIDQCLNYLDEYSSVVARDKIEDLLDT